MKKTRLFLTFAALTLCIVLALCLVSCNTECQHSYTVSSTVSNSAHGTASAVGKYPYQEEITLVAKANLGYNFVGWYDGDTLISTEENYTITVTKNLSLTAKFELSAEMQSFDFTSTETTCEITGIKDKTVTSITIPDCVTSIAEGAFAGCSKLESITLPFVGGSKDATSSTLFGYIFGTSSYDGGVETKQYYSSSSYATYYIPKSLKSVTITGGNFLYGAFCNCSSLTSVTIGNGVTTIGFEAFYDCTSLTSVTIGNSVTIIGYEAFWGCDSLTSITIGNSVTSIGEDAFRYCYNLVEVINKSSLDIDKTTSNGYVGYYALEIHNGESKIVNVDNFLFITSGGVNYLLDYAGSETNLTLPQNYKGESYEIYQYAFYERDDMVSVTIPDSVTSIGERAFHGCDSLTSVTIGNGVTGIGSYAFSGCYKLVEVINKSSLNIDKNDFNGCVGYYALEIHNGQSKIVNVDDFLFITSGGVNYLLGYVGSETSLTLPQNYKGESYEIYKYAFYNRDDIVSVAIPDSVTSIGSCAFSSCTSLTSVTIPNSVTSIGGSAFYSCASLTSITIPNSVTSIGYSAFNNCTSLTSVTIPNSVTSIGTRAFYECSGLASVTIPDSVTSIGSWAFYNCYRLTSVTIGNSVTSIGNYAFENCYKLVEVINKSSLDIGKNTSNGNVGYYALEIHNGQSKIVNVDDFLFITSGGVNYLLGYVGSETNLTLPQNYKGESYEIYKYAFYYRDDIVSVTIPDSVTSIGNYAFYYCRSLTSVTIPDSVTRIGMEAFRSCSSLKSINYRGTATQWKAISKGSNWNSSTGDYTIYYNYKD